MKNRVMSIILVLVLAFSCVPVGSITAIAAADYTEPTIYVDSKYAAPGSTVKVDVNVKNNPGIAGATLSVSYDSKLTLSSAQSGSAFSKLSFTAPGRFDNPSDFLWDSESGQVNDDGTMLSLTFEVAADAEANEQLNVNVSYYSGDIYNENLENVNFQTVNGCVTVIDYIPGDANGDGAINGKDVTLIRRNIVGGYDITINESAADVNSDGRVNGVDVTLIRRYIVGGYDVELKPSKPKCSHTMSSVAYKAATCTENGNIAYWHCSKCDKYFSNSEGTTEVTLENTVIPATGHILFIDDAVPPTYESTGLTEGSHCAVCGEIIVKQEVVPKLEKSEYSITYYVDNNDNYLQQQTINNSNSTSYTSEEGLVLKDLIVNGYNFKGWYTSQTGGNKVTKIAEGSKGDKVLYAQWEKVEYTITFDSPDIPVSPVTYTVDKGATLVSPYCFGYTFVGWSVDGEIVSIIPPGTTGSITLHANWTSNRNKARSVAELKNPNIIEDLDNGQYLFVYEIGTLDNVPLLDGSERVINSEGINITDEVTLAKAVNQSTADRIAKSVSNATTKTSGWTLSEDWNKTTSATNVHDEQIGKTQERTDSEGNVVAGRYYVSNSKGGSTSVSSSSGGSSSNSSKVTLGASTGINTNYGIDSQIGASVNSNVSNTKSKEFDWNIGGNYGRNNSASIGAQGNGLSAGLSSGSSWGINGGIGGKNTNSTTTSTGVTVEGSVKNSANVANARNYNVGTENSSSSEGHWDTSSSSSSSWNSTNGYESSKETSKNTSISNAISEIISNKYSYSSTDSVGGSNSETRSTGETQELTDEYASTVEYSTEEGTSESKTVSYKSSATGYYRVITAGTLHVFAVVGYDIATNSYFTYTYNILDKERHSYLDYSKDNANFDDCENGILPFEIPYDVHEYISVKIGKSSGLRVSESTGMVTAYTGKADYVVIPEYVSVTDSLNKPKAVRITGFTKDVFAGNTNIKGIILPKHIQSIPENAFDGCTSLETVIGYGINDIGTEAFKNCTSLKSFIVDEFLQKLGDRAFENTEELYVNAANTSVAEAALDSGATHLILCLSDMEGNLENKRIVISDSTKFFALLSDGKAYKNLSIESNADETFLSNFRLVENSDTPLKINSDKITLSRVVVENSPGFALIIPKDNASIKMYGDVELSSKGENAIITKNVDISLLNNEVDATLNITGNYLINEKISNNQKLDISFDRGQLLHINDEQFDAYLTSSLVNFDANGGTLSETTKLVYYGQTYGTLPEPTKDNYTFDGWYTAQTGGTKVTEDSVVNALVNQTLYAHWKAKEFTVTFDANEGIVSQASKKVTYGNTFGELPVPQRDYCTFAGWYTKKEASNDDTAVTADTVATSSNDITLYANWKLNEPSEFVLASEVPDGAQIINQKWTYTLREYKESSSSSLSGYTKYDTKRTGWGGTQGPVYSDPSNGIRNVWSESYVTSSNYKTVYHYYRYSVNYSGGYGSYAQSSSYPNYYEYNFDSPLEYYGDVYGHAGYKWWYSSTNYVTLYQRSPFTTQEWVSDNYGTRWYYQDPVYTYYYYRDLDKESASDPTGQSNVSNVQKWVQYRAK